MKTKLDMVVHAFIPRTQETEMGWFQWIPGQPELHSRTKSPKRVKSDRFWNIYDNLKLAYLWDSWLGWTSSPFLWCRIIHRNCWNSIFVENYFLPNLEIPKSTSTSKWSIQNIQFHSSALLWWLFNVQIANLMFWRLDIELCTLKAIPSS